jgi:hypothetical protein
MSNEQILQFVEQHKPRLEAQGIHALTCVQTAGDVMIIPESWSHGVLNIQVSLRACPRMYTAMRLHRLTLLACVYVCVDIDQQSVAVATEALQSHWRPKQRFRSLFAHMTSSVPSPNLPGGGRRGLPPIHK